MSDNRPIRDSMCIEEATISNMWEIAAIVEVLERKGLCTKQDLYDIINSAARIPVCVFLRRPSLSLATVRHKAEDQCQLYGSF